ncbi:hypothetical protein RvY_03525 [Ramazzottius varieornatus]|uniref:Uncharacterized protein n=1 Tax=Ramazzottius varieornatus TaxID=947166 RepID=A0A1D1UNE8_RAMVA|nr:hypothetical protein RvY_03525 [Ramazzottius varieornatus]
MGDLLQAANVEAVRGPCSTYGRYPSLHVNDGKLRYKKKYRAHSFLPLACCTRPYHKH